jgi:hypothetical protein
MRNQTFLAAAVTLAMTLVACVGGIDSPTPGDDDDDDPTQTARQQFDQKIFPLMTQCEGCHVGPETSPTNMWLGATLKDKDGYYAAMENDRAIVGNFVPESATVLSKGLHEGPAWSTQDAATITAWLLAEQMARGVDTNPVPPADASTTARGAMMQWAQCLSVSEAEFESTQAYRVAQMNTENGRCDGCHNDGAGGVIMRPQAQKADMLLHWQEEVFVIGAFSPQIQTGTTPATYKMIAAEAKYCAKGQEKENNLGTHPSFNCDQTGLQNLKDFVTAVQTKLTAGQCGTPPAFADPTPL